MEEFNPDAYLKAKAFDPDTYLADKQNETSVLGATGRGALDALPFGVKGAAAVQSKLGSGSYDKYLGELDALLKADKEQHPIAHGAGEVAGSVAPFLIPGVGEALGAETLAGRAAVGAGIGGLQAASNTRNPLDSEAGIQDIAKGAGIGALINPAIGGIGSFLSKAVSPGVPLAEEALVNETPKAIPAISPAFESGESKLTGAQGVMTDLGKPSGIANMAKSEGPAGFQAPQGKGLVSSSGEPLSAEVAPSENELKARFLTQVLGGSARQLRNLPGKNMVQTLNDMGDVINENNLVSPLDRFSTRLNKFQAAHDNAGRVIGATIEKADVPPIPVTPLAEKINATLKFPNPDQLSQAQGLTKQLAAYADENGNLSFQRLQQLKSDLGDQAYKGQGDPVLQHAYHVISDAQDQQLEAVSNLQGINKPVFDKAKTLYQVTSRSLPMLRMATAKSLVNKPSLTELLSGHPISAITKAVGEPLHRAAGAIGFKATSALENVPTGKAATMLSAVPSAYQPVFQNAVAGLKDPAEIQKQLTVTDFVMQSQNPGYAAAKKAMGEPQ